MKHNPQYKYDCKNCKFNWTCGYLCGCNLNLPEPPQNIIVVMNKLRIKEDVTPYKLEEQVERVYGGIFTKHYSPSNPIWGSSWKCKQCYRSEWHKNIKTIKNLILKGYKVKAGWCGTSVKGHREYFIFYK